MDVLCYEWDEEKNRSNQQKHGISFQEAATVFEDEHALLIDDPDHSLTEERFIILGISQKARLLVVCHCYRSADLHIRIISARKATRKESDTYAQHAPGR